MSLIFNKIDYGIELEISEKIGNYWMNMDTMNQLGKLITEMNMAADTKILMGHKTIYTNTAGLLKQFNLSNVDGTYLK